MTSCIKDNIGSEEQSGNKTMESGAQYANDKTELEAQRQQLLVIEEPRFIRFIYAAMDHTTAFMLGFLGTAVFVFFSCLVLNTICAYWSNGTRDRVEATLLSIFGTFTVEQDHEYSSRSWNRVVGKAVIHVWSWSKHT